MSYVQNRIAALTRQGSIDRLRDEARTIRCAVADACRNPQYDYAWMQAQLARAEAFDAEARRLDDERPAGAAGLAS